MLILAANEMQLLYRPQRSRASKTKAISYPVTVIDSFFLFPPLLPTFIVCSTLFIPLLLFILRVLHCVA